MEIVGGHYISSVVTWYQQIGSFFSRPFSGQAVLFVAPTLFFSPSQQAQGIGMKRIKGRNKKGRR